MYIENINSPVDVKKLTVEELRTLADEMRSNLINKLSKSGGHIGPNLGIVEVTTAFHYVFDSPKDKIVFDVSHQCYPHKMLTGRQEAYTVEEKFNSVSGYTNPSESEHDHFIVGHTSTSISLATGLAKARDVLGKSENIVALIGDGSLGGGEALEGLNYAAELKSNLIIIVNDNDQSIAENHGGLYIGLKELRETNGASPNNVFKAMGLEYRYLDDGHDLEKLVALFNEVKDNKTPVVVHIHTIKGKGLKYAEVNREAWHAGPPFNVEDGSRPNNGPGNTVVADNIYKVLDSNKTAVALTASTPGLIGMTPEYRKKYSKQYVDVGIAEEHAMAMASGIAANGGTPILGIFSCFLQRTYDQLSSDVCLNNNPIVLLVGMGGVYGLNSNTHLGLSDISLISNIANLVYLAPTSKEEYEAMFKYATSQKSHPIAIRIPAGHVLVESGITDNTDYSILDKYQMTQEGTEVAIIGASNMYPLALEVANTFQKDTGKKITVINPKFISGVDSELLDKLQENHKLIITLEDGIIEGGFGSKISSYLGNKDILVKNYGIKKSFPNDYVAKELLEDNGLCVDTIINEIKSIFKTKGIQY